jgi:hypothetical protein
VIFRKAFALKSLNLSDRVTPENWIMARPYPPELQTRAGQRDKPTHTVDAEPRPQIKE